MLVDSSNSAVGAAVTGAIRQASQATGTSFDYLLATAQVESGLNPQAGAPTSSARGLFQFVEQTWLGMMKESGAALGYGRYAAAITKTASGHYAVHDPALRGEILKLRNDPTANAVMAGAFTKANASILTDKLGRPPSEGELYIAHFLGAGGAARLIKLAAGNPNAKATHFFANAAQANSSIFYDRATGAARSVAQVRNILTARYEVARNGQGQAVAAAQAASAVAPVGAPDTAGMTNVFAAAAAGGVPPAALAATAAAVPAASLVPIRAASDHQVFHSLFTDISAGSPAAPAMNARAAVPRPALNATGAAPRQAIPGGMLDLFKDPPRET